MLIRARAPLRISFAGGGTDVPPYPEMEGGCVLSATISRYAYGTLRPRDDEQIVVRSVDYDVVVNYSVHDRLELDGQLDLVKAAITKLRGQESRGFDLFLHTEAPPGSGLGSSSALAVVLIGLLKEFKNLTLTDYDVAHLAWVLERQDLGIAGGYQDQYAATFGGFNYIEFFKDRVVVNPLRLPVDVVNELQHNLVLCHTGTVRLSGGIIEDQVRRYETGETLEALRELKQLTVAMKAALLHRQYTVFGRLLHEEWQVKKALSPKISTPAIDRLYDLAREAGAIGGKVTGAGGGGYMLLYCPFNKKVDVEHALRSAGVAITEFSFEQAGLQTWRVNDE